MRTSPDCAWMARAMPWPCCAPKMSVRRISRSSVPCRCAECSRSARFRIDIRPEYAYPPGRMSTRKRSGDDFDREIQAHLELETERLIREGLSPDAARARARRAFGNVTRARERFYESAHRLWIDRLRQDIRCGLRGLRRSPLAATVAIVSLAGGIGATT